MKFQFTQVINRMEFQLANADTIDVLIELKSDINFGINIGTLLAHTNGYWLIKLEYEESCECFKLDLSYFETDVVTATIIIEAKNMFGSPTTGK